MTITVSECGEFPVGTVLLTLDGVSARPGAVAFRLSRFGHTLGNLGPSGWQGAPVWLRPERAWFGGGQLRLLLGGDVTEHADSTTYQLTVVGADGAVLGRGTFFWPESLPYEDSLTAPPAGEPWRPVEAARVEDLPEASDEAAPAPAARPAAPPPSPATPPPASPWGAPPPAAEPGRSRIPPSASGLEMPPPPVVAPPPMPPPPAVRLDKAGDDDGTVMMAPAAPATQSPPPPPPGAAAMPHAETESEATIGRVILPRPPIPEPPSAAPPEPVRPTPPPPPVAPPSQTPPPAERIEPPPLRATPPMAEPLTAEPGPAAQGGKPQGGTPWGLVIGLGLLVLVLLAGGAWFAAPWLQALTKGPLSPPAAAVTPPPPPQTQPQPPSRPVPPPQTTAPPQTTSPEPPAARAPTPEELARIPQLKARGLEALRQGDLATAASYYSYAADLGDAAAAFSAAELFDPLILQAGWQEMGYRADAQRAEDFYRRAQSLGDARAAARLQALQAWRTRQGR